MKGYQLKEIWIFCQQLAVNFKEIQISHIWEQKLDGLKTPVADTCGRLQEHKWHQI